MTERTRHCGSTFAFGDCRFAGERQPICSASAHAWARCEHRSRGFGEPTVLDVIDERNGCLILGTDAKQEGGQ